MKRFILLIISVLFFSVAHSQNSFHNYFSQTTADYIQIGYGQKYILFRYPSPNNQFVRLNYIGTNEGMKYYGNNNFQVVVSNNSSQVCVCTAQYSNWYNYCGPVPAPDPYRQSNNGRNSTVTSSKKCPWCDGTGRITKDESVVNYVPNDYVVKVKCNECGIEYYKTYRNHYHLNCGHCGGTGKLTR